MQYDFRSVYGSILEDWFCIPKADVKKLLYDDYQHIPILKDTTAIDDPISDGRLRLNQNFPNPVEDWTTISFRTDGGHLQINLFDSRGVSIRTLVDRKLSPGEHEIRMDATDLAAGVYYIRLQEGDHQLMKMMAKV